MRSITDEQFRSWSHGLRNADVRSYEALYDATFESLLRYATYYVHDRSAATDIIQDVFLKIWRIRRDVDPERSLRALLYQMVRNYSLNHERQRKKHASDELEAEDPSVRFDIMADESLDADALAKHLRSWIDEMPARRREAFLLSRYEGLRHEEISMLMDLAPKTVNNHIVLALQFLREKLKEYEELDNIVGRNTVGDGKQR